MKRITLLLTFVVLLTACSKSPSAPTTPTGPQLVNLQSTTRTWIDANNNSIPDCNLLNPAEQNFLAAGGDNCGAASSLTPTSGPITVNPPSSVVIFSLHVTDAGATFTNMPQVVLTSPSGRQLVSCCTVALPNPATDATVSVPVPIPLRSEAGVWTISVQMTDNAGHSTVLSATTLAAAGFVSTVTVTG
jgi:hypothetical protein